MAVFALAACFTFNLRQSLPGGYYLEGWQSGRDYTLGGPQYSADAGGVLAGSVERIGWNDSYIVAWRTPMLANEATGWMVVDVRTGALRGPMSDAALEILQAAEPRLKGIVLKPPAEYFQK